MKLNILTTVVLLAIAGAFGTQSAKAQFTEGDLILNFTEGGNSTNYEIDLGAASTILSYNGSTPEGLVNINTDLSSVYGAGYATNPNLSFVIYGNSTNGANSVLFVSDSTTDAYSSQNNGQLSGIIGANFVPALNPNAGTPPPVAGSTPGGLEVPTTNGASYQSLVSLALNGAPNALVSFGATAPTAYIDTLTGGSRSGTSTVSSDFFTITAGGEVTFGPTASIASVPEPSTYALMILGGAMIFFWQARRKSVSSL